MFKTFQNLFQILLLYLFISTFHCCMPIDWMLVEKQSSWALIHFSWLAVSQNNYPPTWVAIPLGLTLDLSLHFPFASLLPGNLWHSTWLQTPPSRDSPHHIICSNSHAASDPPSNRSCFLWIKDWWRSYHILTDFTIQFKHSNQTPGRDWSPFASAEVHALCLLCPTRPPARKPISHVARPAKKYINVYISYIWNISNPLAQKPIFFLGVMFPHQLLGACGLISFSLYWAAPFSNSWVDSVSPINIINMVNGHHTFKGSCWS